jgi:broad specificity phosphatase PhoE
VGEDPLARATARIVAVAYDPVSIKLSAVAPIAPELVEAFGRFEGLTLTELQREFAAADERFRAWVRDPANEGRPISDAPDYLDRIALDSLLERRTWAE